MEAFISCEKNLPLLIIYTPVVYLFSARRRVAVIRHHGATSFFYRLGHYFEYIFATSGAPSVPVLVAT
jgi:hypothetical protein